MTPAGGAALPAVRREIRPADLPAGRFPGPVLVETT